MNPTRRQIDGRPYIAAGVEDLTPGHTLANGRHYRTWGQLGGRGRTIGNGCQVSRVARP